MESAKDSAQFWRKQHRRAGLAVAVLILVFCISDIILNHRKAVRGIDVSRDFLPSSYRIQNFNNGVIKWTLALTEDSVLAFGSCGVWLTDRDFNRFEDFNNGFPTGNDNRNIKKTAPIPGSDLDNANYRHIVCGYSTDSAMPIVFDYAKGADLPLSSNELLEKQPMSLWNFALELHVGRCYSPFLGPVSDLFIFISGLVITLILISGFIVSKKLNKHNKINK